MKIRYYYDRHTRSWIIFVLDENNFDIEYSYVGNKEDRDFEINYFKEKYNITDARKYRRDE